MLFPQPQTGVPLSEECHAYRDHGDDHRADGSGRTCPVRARSDRNDCDHGGKLTADKTGMGEARPNAG